MCMTFACNSQIIFVAFLQLELVIFDSSSTKSYIKWVSYNFSRIFFSFFLN